MARFRPFFRAGAFSLFAGRVCPITVGGIGIGMIGFSGGEMDGVVYSWRSPEDIAGTYGAAGAGFTIIGGPRVA